MKQAFQIKKQLRCSFHIGELVLSSDIWPFSNEDVLVDLYANFEKLHMIRVNPEHAGKVEKLYTTSRGWDELAKMRAHGKFEVIACPILGKIRPMRQLKLTNMNWLDVAPHA